MLGATRRVKPRTREFMRTNLLAPGLCLLVLAGGCRFEVDPSDVEVEILHVGRYALEKGVPELVEETSEVTCEPGVIFGVDYRIIVKGGGFGTLPLSFWWVHPELAIPSRQLWGTETRALAAEPRIDWGERALPGRTLWSLEHPEERVDGRYRFEIRRTDDGTTLAAATFLVEGC